MLTRIEAISSQGALLSLPLEDLDNGLLLDEVGGLDPVKATITSSPFGKIDGSQYQSSRREERNITLKITLVPDFLNNETVRALRRRLYAYFMPKSAVTLKFYSDDMDPVQISGHVESFETALFSAEPAVDISIICNDPDFNELDTEKFSGNTTAGTTETLLAYPGDVETGIVFTLRPNRDITAFSIYQRAAGVRTQLDFQGALQAGDVLTVSTISGSKYARLLRGGVTTSFLYGVSPQSTWLEIQPGDNFFRVYTSGAAIPFDMVYTNKYGGL